MSAEINFWEKPQAEEIFLIAGWRQWADGGSVSSGLPQYLIDLTNARKIGEISPDGYYLFQLPGAQQFLRPIVRHNHGVTESLQAMRNEFFYVELNGKGIVIFLGDEPHLDAERYTRTLLSAAKELKVKQIIHLGGVYGQVPYDKPRHVHAIISHPHLEDIFANLSVEASNYHGPSSIGSYLTKRAGEQEMESIGFYAFCPIYQFGGIENNEKNIIIEQDHMAWLTVTERINHLLEVTFDLTELEDLAVDLVNRIDAKIARLNSKYPEMRLEDFFGRLRDNFEEQTFTPLDDIWEDSLRRLGDEFFPQDDEE
ncbi:MAG: PAC2 family protein [Anaerolineales bacterium]|nr:PAC2 family protein [Anaerolineales bacterium]